MGGLRGCGYRISTAGCTIKLNG
ncbi:hypothetical protein [Acaryochloris sp. IP29b_bin.137]